MAKAKKLHSGNYRVRVYCGKDTNGKQKYKSITAPTKKEAEYQAAAYAINRKQIQTNNTTPFKIAAKNYIEAKKNILSPSTVRGYNIILSALSDIENLPIDTLQDVNTVQKIINEKAVRYSAKTLKNQFGFISVVLKYYHMNVPNVTLKPKEKHPIAVPTKTEAERIIKIIKNYPDIECQILLALTCGLRQSEIAAITPAHIKGQKLVISSARVFNEKNQLVLKNTPKSAAGYRTVIMTPYLTKRLKEIAKGKQQNEWLFEHRYTTTYEKFKKALVENGMHPYSVHSLRHCFAAILHAHNIPDKYVMKLGGWSTDNVLRNVYQYTFEEDALNAQNNINHYFNNVFESE